jgi:PhnB protein
MAVQTIPEGFNTVNVYLVVDDARAAIDFYCKAFGGSTGTIMRMPNSDDIMHAEVRIGSSTVMLSQENPEWNVKSAKTLGGSPVSMHLYVEDADSFVQRAVEAGCELTHPVEDAFWGDRHGKVTDPFGLQWGVATHIEELSDEEMAKRAAAFFAAMQNPDG